MALTANRDVPRFVDQELRTLKVKAAAHIYKGGFVGIDRATGYIRPLAGADLFAGVAYEECDNSSGADGDVSCRLYTQGDFQTTLSGAALTDVGRPAFATDDNTLTLSPGTNGSQVGRCVDVPKAGEVIVRIEPLWLAQDVQTTSARLDSSTGAATTNPIMVTQRPIIVTSVQAVFNVVPDVGLLDV
ncbi:MAG: hypothetical protein V3T70_07455, partial [Phycisphaerae bacterium]